MLQQLDAVTRDVFTLVRWAAWPNLVTYRVWRFFEGLLGLLKLTHRIDNICTVNA